MFYIFYPSKFPHGFINNCNCPRFYYSTDLRRAKPIYSRPLMWHPAVEFGVLAMQNVSPLDTTRKHLRHLRELLKQCQWWHRNGLHGEEHERETRGRGEQRVGAWWMTAMRICGKVTLKCICQIKSSSRFGRLPSCLPPFFSDSAPLCKHGVDESKSAGMDAL